MDIDRHIAHLDKKNHFKQSNRLVEARYKLTPGEQKIVIAIVSQIAKNGDSFETIRVNAADLINFCGFTATDINTKLQNMLIRLRQRVIRIGTPTNHWKITGWINSAEYHDGVIDFEIDKRLKDDLLNLRSAYLSSSAQLLMSFKRDYSPRLYMLLRKALKLKTINYDIDFIIDRFELPNSYKFNFTHFRKKFLEPCLCEINETSDITIKHEYIKEGRSFKKIKFTVIEKEKNKQLPEPVVKSAKQKKVDKIEDLDDIEKKTGQIRLVEPDPAAEDIINRLAKYEISRDTATNLIQKYGIKRIDANLRYAYERRQGKWSMSGWIIRCIESDRAASAAETKKIAEGVNRSRSVYTTHVVDEDEVKPTGSPLPDTSPFKKYERKNKKNN